MIRKLFFLNAVFISLSTTPYQDLAAKILKYLEAVKQKQ